MLSKRYAEASCEVLNILNHMSKEDLLKVSCKFIDFLRTNASRDYIPNLDYSKNLKDMNLKEETRALLSIMYKKYWCSEEEKQVLQKRSFINEQKHQRELRERYNPDDIFKVNNKENSTQKNGYVEQTNISDDNILGKIKSLFKKV